MNAILPEDPLSRPTMGDLARYPARPLAGVEGGGESIALVWPDGRRTLFHALWLRDNCPCPACRHPETLERRWLLIEAAEEPFVSEASILPGGHLGVRFADGHESRFDGGWLAAQAYDAPSLAERRPQRRLWRGDHRPARITHSAFTGGEEGLAAFLRPLLAEGIAILSEAPRTEGEILRLARLLGEPRASNFGQVYDVISRPKPNNSAYTAEGLELHSDLANWRWPPDFQFLYCLANEAEGGGSLFADGLAAAEALRVEDANAYEILVTTPVAFRFHDESCDLRFSAPTIETNPMGEAVAIRFNNWLRAALAAPAERVTPWYDAYRKLWRLLRDPAFRIELKLVAGEMVAFDNRRVLHGRRAFDPQSGRRHLQGLYMNRDDLESRLRLIERNNPA